MIIAEIGFNHLGDATIADEYVSSLVNSSVDALTFQVREPGHRLDKPHRYFDDNEFKTLIEKAKKANKKVGAAVADPKYISFFDSLGVDFFKVIRNDIKDKDLLKELITTKKKIFVSTGMASSEDIEEFVKFVQNDKEQFTLIHTQLSNNLEDCNLKSIETMRSFGMNVAYGSHCGDDISIFMSLCYDPSDIFLYVKGNKSAPYPDDKHAIKIDDLQCLLTRIKKYEKVCGTGTKIRMKNKIEVLKKTI